MTPLINSGIYGTGAAALAAVGSSALREAVLTKNEKVALLVLSAATFAFGRLLNAWETTSQLSREGSKVGFEASQVNLVVAPLLLAAALLSPLTFFVSKERIWQAVAFTTLPAAAYFAEGALHHATSAAAELLTNGKFS